MDNILNAIAEERKKQMQNGQYLLKDRYASSNDILANLAAFYASKNDLYCLSINHDNSDIEHLKKSQLTRQQQLVTAGALIIAELQRLKYLECDLYCFVKYMS